MQFFLDIEPPTATAQEQKTTVRGGIVRKYDPPKAKAAKALLAQALKPYVPPEPADGPLALIVEWRFPRGTSHKKDRWRITRPDTDNLQKGLKDVMTRLGFWVDDSRVCFEQVTKKYHDHPGIMITISKLEAAGDVPKETAT